MLGTDAEEVNDLSKQVAHRSDDAIRVYFYLLRMIEVSTLR